LGGLIGGVVKKASFSMVERGLLKKVSFSSLEMSVVKKSISAWLDWGKKRSKKLSKSCQNILSNLVKINKKEPTNYFENWV
jgi:hypothetical protein